jgi:hypothetical protein
VRWRTAHKRNRNKRERQEWADAAEIVSTMSFTSSHLVEINRAFSDFREREPGQ